MAEGSSPARAGLAPALAVIGLLIPAPALPLQTPAPASAPQAPSQEALAAAARGAKLFEQRQYAAALVELEKALAGGARDGRTLYRAGESQRQTGKSRADVLRTLSEAVTALDRVVHGEGKPELVDRLFLAQSYAGIGDAATAGKTARDALDAYRRGDLGVVTEMDATNLMRLGRLAVLAGDLQMRKAFFGRAVDRLTGAGDASQAVLAQALTELGTAQVEAGEHQAAVASLTRVIEMGTPPPGARTALARALFRNGDYESAARQWSALRVEQPVLATEATYAMMIMRTLAQADLLRTPDRPLEDMKGLSRAELEQRMDEISARMTELAAELPPELVKRGYARRDTDDATLAKMLELRDLKLRLAWAGAEYVVRGHPIREFAFTGGMQASLRDWKLPKMDRNEGEAAPPPLDILGPEQRAEFEASKAGRRSRRQEAKKAAEKAPEKD